MATHRWIEGLDDDEQAFIKRFVLASGSLKELAQGYGVSYPTVRLRLDRLIQKIRLLDEHACADRFERLVWTLYADGRIDACSAKALVDEHQRGKENGSHANGNGGD